MLIDTIVMKAAPAIVPQHTQDVRIACSAVATRIAQFTHRVDRCRESGIEQDVPALPTSSHDASGHALPKGDVIDLAGIFGTNKKAGDKAYSRADCRTDTRRRPD